MTDLLAYTFFYSLFVIGLLFPPKEFVSAGVTIADLFSTWLGQEYNTFIQYHIKRSILTLLIHSLLPFGYVVGLTVLGHVDAAQLFLGTEHPLWLTLALCALIGPIYTLYKTILWSNKNWSEHPIAKSLTIHCNGNETWMHIASQINIEFRSLTKLQIATNTVTKVVVTDNWIMQVSPYTVDIASQMNSKLVCYEVHTYPSIPTTVRDVDCAYVKYRVKPRSDEGKVFTIRLNFNDVENFKAKVIMPIEITPTCSFPKRIVEMCIDWVKVEATNNPVYITTQELDKCSVCINAPSNVKLIKRCPNIPATDGIPACESCHCPPRSCMDCLVKWFMASSTAESVRSEEELMQLKGSCPQCRSTFCFRDISYVKYEPIDNSNKTET